MNEFPVVIDCQGEQLFGIVHPPAATPTLGVVIVVAGGPQYRVGAHRQFVLLARALASSGVVALRFDHRGTGDSGGEYRGFVDMHDDIGSAIDRLQHEYPSVKRIVLWGECESATAIAFYGSKDPRVRGIFMVNPWVRTESGHAKTYIKHYYRDRLFGKQLWLKIASGEFSIGDSVRSLFELVRSARGKNRENLDEVGVEDADLPARLERCVEQYSGELYVLTSGRDLIAQEFKDYFSASRVWKAVHDSGRLVVHEIDNADHTFSRQPWREALFAATHQWIGDKLSN